MKALPATRQQYVVGLTGGIGSGKSEVARCLATQGVPIIDTDAIAHRLTEPDQALLNPLRAAFGESVFTLNGQLDRAALRTRIFASSADRLTLQNLIHPLICQSVQTALLQTASAPYSVVVIPLLIQTSGEISAWWTSRLQQIWVVDCEPETQVSRVVARSGLSPDEVQAIMNSQASRAQRLAKADAVILNDHQTETQSLGQRVTALHAQMLAELDSR